MGGWGVVAAWDPRPRTYIISYIYKIYIYIYICMHMRRHIHIQGNPLSVTTSVEGWKALLVSRAVACKRLEGLRV